MKLFILTLKSVTFKTQFSKHQFYTHRSPLNPACFPSNSRFPSDSLFHLFQEKPQLTINHNFHLTHHTHSFSPNHITFTLIPLNHTSQYIIKEMTKIPFTLQNDLHILNSNPFSFLTNSNAFLELIFTLKHMEITKLPLTPLISILAELCTNHIQFLFFHFLHSNHSNLMPYN